MDYYIINAGCKFKLYSTGIKRVITLCMRWGFYEAKSGNQRFNLPNKQNFVFLFICTYQGFVLFSFKSEISRPA